MLDLRTRCTVTEGLTEDVRVHVDPKERAVFVTTL